MKLKETELEKRYDSEYHRIDKKEREEMRKLKQEWNALPETERFFCYQATLVRGEEFEKRAWAIHEEYIQLGHKAWEDFCAERDKDIPVQFKSPQMNAYSKDNAAKFKESIDVAWNKRFGERGDGESWDDYLARRDARDAVSTLDIEDRE